MYIFAEDPHIHTIMKRVSNGAFAIVFNLYRLDNLQTLQFRNIQIQKRLDVFTPIISENNSEYLHFNSELFQKYLNILLRRHNYIDLRQSYKIY